MKILVIDQVFYPEVFRINDVVEELVKRGNEVTVLTGYPNYPKGKFYDGYAPGLPYNDDYKGAKIVRVKISPRKSGKINLAKNYLSFWFNANKWVKRNAKGYDITYSCQLSPVFMSLPCITAKKKFKIPTVINVQDLWPESFESVMNIHSKLIIKPLEILANKVYKNADKLLCSSKSFMKNMIDRGISEEKLIYWPQFSNEYELENLESPKEYVTKYRFIFTGNIGKAQGLGVVLDAAKLSKSNEDISYYLIGEGSDKESLIKQAENEGLSNVYFIEKKLESEIPAYLKNCTAALACLKESKIAMETLPAKIQMYMSCGAPIISTITGEVGEIIKEAKCGIVANENNGQALYEKVEEFIGYEESALEEFSTNGKAYNRETFNKSKLLDMLEETLNKCIKK